MDHREGFHRDSGSSVKSMHNTLHEFFYALFQ